MSLSKCIGKVYTAPELHTELRGLARQYAKTMDVDAAEKRAAAELLESTMDDLETVRDHLIDLLRVEDLAPTENPCAQLFPVACRTACRRLERLAQPVVGSQHHPLAGSRGRFDVRKQRSKRYPALIGRHRNLLAAVVGQQVYRTIVAID